MAAGLWDVLSGQQNSGFALVSKRAKTKTKAKEREATKGTDDVRFELRE
jgi:hypothetical protein